MAVFVLDSGGVDLQGRGYARVLSAVFLVLYGGYRGGLCHCYGFDLLQLHAGSGLCSCAVSIFALGFGYFLFGDVPDIPKIIGASIIVGSGIFLFTRERMQEKRKRKEPA